MTISFQVTNKPPETDENCPTALRDLFNAYNINAGGQSFAPFRHQVDVFRLIQENREVFLVAGTAAGKTLAVAVPLFHKLQTKKIRKALFVYPTIALMEDQRRVMDRLAQLVGLEVGQLQGGMARAGMISALNKPVILATPDEIYWFFRKNVKYSGLLIYGLALIDEFVLDEAHLFNGLMLCNLEHLWRRIQSLAAMLGKSPRLHIMTATPTEPLQRLNNGMHITGKSKCQNVTIELRPCGRFDRSDAMVAAINETLAEGRRKVLVVCNSARMAHQLFQKYKINADADISAAHRLRFGKVQLGDLLQWLERSDVEQKLLEGLSAQFFREEDVTLADLPPGAQVDLPLANVVAGVTEVLERQCWLVKRALWDRTNHPGETWESLLHNRPLPCAIVTALRDRLLAAPEPEQQRKMVDEWLAETLDSLGKKAEEQIECRSPDYILLLKVLGAGLGQNLSALVVKRLVHEIKVNPERTNLPLHSLSHRPIYLRWLDWMVEKGQLDRIRTLVQAGLESGDLKAECRHIGLWKGTEVPVIVYSGSMVKHARTGLIDVFADLEHAVLISTSAVEVGVDFAADTLITEECEAAGFLQRFGRVGRHGDGSQVLALVGGDLASQWRALDGRRMSREEFSLLVQATFPKRNYAPASQLVDAGHYLVNAQLGRIGARLNQTSGLRDAGPLADQLSAAEVSVGFGLRSTLQQITLKDGVTKDPFYLLRYVDDRDLRQADSPFEMARAKTWFTELIFRKARFNVMVDLCTTLRASRVWFKMVNGKVQIAQVQRGIGTDYAHKLKAYYEQREGWSPWLPGNFLLLQGDVYLQRADKEVIYPKPEPVCDDEQNPLFIPGQIYLTFLGWKDADEARKLISESPIFGWEELHYDWDGIEFNRSLVLVEKTAGACFAAYQDWMDYVNRCVQK